MSALRPWLVPLFVMLLWSLGLCDDCSSPEDAMDTWWVGIPVKTLVSAVIVAVVNGETIIKTVLTGGKDGDDGGEESEEEPSEFTLDVTTEDHATTLVLDSPEGLWVYASVTAIRPPPGYSAVNDLRTVSFSGPPHLSISSAQMRGKTKAVSVKAVTPADGSTPKEATMMVSGTIGGQALSVPVNFTIDGGYRLVVKTRSDWTGA